MISTNCPECDHLIDLELMPEINQKIACTNCNNLFEVTWLFPVSLDYQDNEEMPPGPEHEITE